MFNDFKSKKPSEIEEEILKFWKQNKIFEKSVSRKSPKGDYIFYDGPPFANGLPHYGHILASIIKDVIPRYQTMKGYKVPRKWGWDCHGLPVENEIEKTFNLKAKKDIEKFGIGKFNEEARKNVLLYADEWKRIIPRIGRWADMENAYKTMDTDYTESVWWVFKSLYDKGLVYEGYKSMHLCPRCETTLANFEVSQGYKDITDISVTAKFELEDEPNTYILAWTTTPWTLPGNAALAVNQSIKYQVVSIKGDNSKYIIAKNRIKDVLKDKEYEVIKEFSGKDLIGKKYKPLFDYYLPAGALAKEGVKDKNLKNLENGWKIYGADFVSINEGTGVVHIAPAFGEDDMNLGKKYDLPFIQHVSIDGKFNQEIKDFVGMPVKPKENHQSADIEIIKWLAGQNKLFSKEKIIHSYPHCWRCDTPLLNYASASWFVKVTAIKDKLISNNKKINWVPSHIKTGRFGKWLEEARDWAISRSRFWGAPLPIWKCEKCNNQKAIGSIEELKQYSKKSGNKYFAMRHGEAEHNVKNIASANLKSSHYLTEKGKKEVVMAAKILRQAQDKIDFIFSSDFARTKETAGLAANCLGIDRKKIIFDNRLREVNVGIFDGKPNDEYHKYFSSLEEKFYKTPPKGENLLQLKNRTTDFLYEIEEKYSGKNILIVSHEYTIWNMFAGAIGADVKKAVAMKINNDDFIKTGEIMPLDFTPLPHNKNYEIDLHRPYIDEIDLQCECDGEMKRITEVFDCWFESGSMPYGQAHYPFERKKEFENNFPAKFIAEGLDQTRGWFYTLLVLSTALFNKSTYKNVIVNGIILAEDGQKMSKRLRNYPDPMEIVNKYGADALRLYLLSSPLVRAENLNFSERGVDEIYKKIILRLWNVFSFYDLYAEKKIKAKSLSLKDMKSKNILDKWILARLNQLIAEITKAMESYELDKAVRPIGDFIDDLSTWYIRRSRARFKTPFIAHKHIKHIKTDNVGEDADNAAKTTEFVLIELSKALAPFMPFISEAFFGLLGDGGESVHLQSWPIFGKKLTTNDKRFLDQMQGVRRICSLGLEARQKAQIKVRQPLASFKLKTNNLKLKTDLLELIKDELNIKEIIFDKNIASDVELDTKITAELKVEGEIREFVRIIQDLRKEAKFTPKNRIVLNISTGDYLKNLISQNVDNLKKEIGADKIEFMKTEKFDAEMETKFENNDIWLGIKKI